MQLKKNKMKLQSLSQQKFQNHKKYKTKFQKRYKYVKKNVKLLTPPELLDDIIGSDVTTIVLKYLDLELDEILHKRTKKFEKWIRYFDYKVPDRVKNDFKVITTLRKEIKDMKTKMKIKMKNMEMKLNDSKKCIFIWMNQESKNKWCGESYGFYYNNKITVELLNGQLSIENIIGELS